ncbi:MULTISPECIES: hypothetical protein [Nocardiopsis]|uniref:Uncharacterized protein n=1 Tax=Nocardiopsis sinuspersici TaxID=501010 RepID=A0A1V3BZ31_9ACTN|nr:MULTISPECIES: hypothetical protein [Nocardiopsis]NYH54745.1 hypothetical protein [Nocardiopsis sinuspersici]OOC53506.1 hypothetical protein NOSIN_06545 [Nocardiopsis sinuspersici]
MQTGPDVLRTTDWTRTFHAYGSGGDTTGFLAWSAVRPASFDGRVRPTPASLPGPAPLRARAR